MSHYAQGDGFHYSNKQQSRYFQGNPRYNNMRSKSNFSKWSSKTSVWDNNIWDSSVNNSGYSNQWIGTGQYEDFTKDYSYSFFSNNVMDRHVTTPTANNNINGNNNNRRQHIRFTQNFPDSSEPNSAENENVQDLGQGVSASSTYDNISRSSNDNSHSREKQKMKHRTKDNGTSKSRNNEKTMKTHQSISERMKNNGRNKGLKKKTEEKLRQKSPRRTPQRNAKMHQKMQPDSSSLSEQPQQKSNPPNEVTSSKNDQEKPSTSMSTDPPNMQDGSAKPYDKDLITKLVNFPHTKKQQMILKRILQEHAKSRKKVTYPRFNLELFASDCSGKDREDLELTKLISEIEFDGLPAEILNNIASALEETGSALEETAVESTSKSPVSEGLDAQVNDRLFINTKDVKRERSNSTSPRIQLSDYNPEKGTVTVTERISNPFKTFMNQNNCDDWLSSVAPNVKKEPVFSSAAYSKENEAISPDSSKPSSNFQVSASDSKKVEEIIIKEEPPDVVESSGPSYEPETSIPEAVAPPSSEPNCAADRQVPPRDTQDRPPSSAPSLTADPTTLEELINMSNKEMVLQSEMQMLDANIARLIKILDELNEKRIKSHSELLKLQGKRTEILYRLQGGIYPPVNQPENTETSQQHIPPTFGSAFESSFNASRLSPGLSTTSSVNSIIQDIANSIKNQITGPLHSGLMGSSTLSFWPNVVNSCEAPETPQNQTNTNSQKPKKAPKSQNSEECEPNPQQKQRKGRKNKRSNGDPDQQPKKVSKTFQEPSLQDDICIDSFGEEQEILLCTMMPNKVNKRDRPSPLEFTWKISNLQAHETAIIDIRLFDGYLYTCSSDFTAKRFDICDPNNVVVYKDHTKTVTSLQVISAGPQTCIYTGSHDGFLRCFNAETGYCINKMNLGGEIICMAQEWRKLFIGLYSGMVYTYGVDTGKILDSFRCSSASIGRICTATEGALHLLCLTCYDDTVTIRDASNGLLIRCLEGTIKSPCCVQVKSGVVYVSTMQRAVLLYELMTGKLIRKIMCPSSVTSLYIDDSYLVASCFDGMIRCYCLKKWLVLNKFYGAGRNRLLCMDVIDNKLITGNQEGVVDVFDYKPEISFKCEILNCIMEFGRTVDLEYHITKDHAPVLMKQNLCPWSLCSQAFSSDMSSEETKQHILSHVKEVLPKSVHHTFVVD